MAYILLCGSVRLIVMAVVPSSTVATDEPVGAALNIRHVIGGRAQRQGKPLRGKRVGRTTQREGPARLPLCARIPLRSIAHVKAYFPRSVFQLFPEQAERR